MTHLDPTPAPAASRARRTAIGVVAAAVLGVLALAPGAPVGAGDQALCEESAAATYVCATYEGFLSRSPGAAELAYWAPRMPAQRSFFVSTLARATEARRFTVRIYYQRFLDASPSEAALQYWAPLVTEPNGLRKLEATLLSSNEATTDEWVQIAYFAQLRRDAGPAEVTYWSDRADATTRNKVAAELSNTPEVRRARVTGVYNNDLGTEPDEPGRVYWAERLRTGTIYLDVRIAFRASAAAYANPSGCPAAAAPIPSYFCAM
ncbi:MAG TPA: hypothetical protein VK507_24790 [Iamia sp.]|nr:hypothetical protein [Iamia sp.]